MQTLDKCPKGRDLENQGIANYQKGQCFAPLVLD